MGHCRCCRAVCCFPGRTTRTRGLARRRRIGVGGHRACWCCVHSRSCVSADQGPLMARPQMRTLVPAPGVALTRRAKQGRTEGSSREILSGSVPETALFLFSLPIFSAFQPENASSCNVSSLAALTTLAFVVKSLIRWCAKVHSNCRSVHLLFLPQ